MRRLIISSIALAATTGHFAVAQETASAFDGPYIGAQAGYAWYDIDVSANGASLGDLDDDGVEGGIYGGYSFTNRMLYGAVEVEGNLSGAEETFVAGPNALKLEANYSLGVSAIAGVVIDDFALVYGRVGYHFLDAEAKAFGASESEQFHGLRLGGGVDFGITENLHARAEYSYTFYDEKTYSDGINTVGVEPSQSLVRIGIHYTF